MQKIDIDAQNGKEMAIAYRVNTVPRIYIVDQNGKPTKVAGFMGIGQALEFLK